jgi:hypothetical protein
VGPPRFRFRTSEYGAGTGETPGLLLHYVGVPVGQGHVSHMSGEHVRDGAPARIVGRRQRSRATEPVLVETRPRPRNNRPPDLQTSRLRLALCPLQQGGRGASMDAACAALLVKLLWEWAPLAPHGSRRPQPRQRGRRQQASALLGSPFKSSTVPQSIRPRAP